MTFLRAALGRLPREAADNDHANAYMTLRERIDFLIVFMIFGVLVGV